MALRSWLCISLLFTLAFSQALTFSQIHEQDDFKQDLSASGSRSTHSSQDSSTEPTTELRNATRVDIQGTRVVGSRTRPSPSHKMTMVPVVGLIKPGGQSKVANAKPAATQFQMVEMMPSSTLTGLDNDEDDLSSVSRGLSRSRKSSSSRGKGRSRFNRKTHRTPDRSTWGRYSIDTDYTRFTPDTGITRHYTLVIDEANLAPDGVNASFMQVFNGQFPGPLLEANWGDEMEITVINQLSNNGTSIHWHGFIQTNRSQYDGVNGVTQCPIPPGASMVYKIRAERYGTTWYHSHTSIQYGNGAYGPMLIHGPTSADWDEDLGTLLIGDWYNASAFDLLERFFDSGPQSAQSTVFNGQGVQNRSGKLVGNFYEITNKVKFRPGRRYLLRIINSAIDAKYELSLDQHNLTVISLDFVPIKPFKTRTVFLAIGQRVEVVIRATGDEDASYWFRADTTATLGQNRGTTCGDLNISANQSKALVMYAKSNDSSPNSQPHLYTPHCSDVTNNVSLVHPIVPLRLPPPKYNRTYIIDPTLTNGTGDIIFRINQSSLYLNFNKPTLNLINDGFTTFPRSYNVYRLDGTAEDSVLIVIQDQTGIPHPMHLHGHDMSVASVGPGPWNGSINFNNPPRRDTVQMDGNGHLVMHFLLDNVGPFLWHCHIAFHVSAGLGAQFIERLNDINTVTNVTETYRTCSRWDAWTRFNLVLQRDSGV